MWSLAHSQGIKTKNRDYWEFLETITVNPLQPKSFEGYLKLFDTTELIQSSPEGMEESALSVVSGAYRKNLITRLEMRFNPMLRNRNGERDLDHIILATIRGMERATLEYPIRAGLIIMLDRRFSPRQNEVLVEKAIKYRHRGVVGIDVGGPQNPAYKVEDIAELYAKAASAGLGLTAHAGEETSDNLASTIEELGVSRIGHGVKAVGRPELLALLRDKGVTLELCPSSNLSTGVVSDKSELAKIVKTLLDEEIKFTINTDGPEMLQTSLRKERALLKDGGMLDDDQLLQCEQWAREASFLR
ncbi:hypothetical protein AUJ14_01565 [Candidatus Micrarchaeota archaeon CG1_02_55_22]|nr:MAG: hypothetical protein AUJ14_01565 [Candidatus Micrarchaeota archaeon CG1_02_55_22]